MEFCKATVMKYEGGWMANKREGKGKITWGKGGEDFVEGEFRNHKVQGEGISVTKVRATSKQ